MSKIPLELLYLPSHEWVRVEDDGHITVGITDYAQETLGDVVYVELPDPGASVVLGSEVGVVESVKAASDIYAPLTGDLISKNDALNDSPETVNNDPYISGWFFKMKFLDKEELNDFMDSEQYADYIKSKG